MGQITSFAPGLWVAHQPLRVAGFSLGHRMAIIRLADGSLVVHSPIEGNAHLTYELTALGDVKFIIAPSKMHDLYLEDWLMRFPEARLLHSPALPQTLKMHGRASKIEEKTKKLFGDELQFELIGGMPGIDEVVFFHQPSRTLIVADLVFNLPPGSGWQRILQSLNGIYAKVGCSRFFRKFIKDKGAFRRSIERVLAWDFDRLVVGHGNNLESGAREAIKNALTSE
jgi:hypothetical protein